MSIEKARADAAQIKSAAKTDLNNRPLRESILEHKSNAFQKTSDVSRSQLARAFKTAGQAYQQLKPLEATAYLDALGNLLNLAKWPLELILKEASNDEFMNLANYWDTYLNELGS